MDDDAEALAEALESHAGELRFGATDWEVGYRAGLLKAARIVRELGGNGQSKP